MKCIRVAAVASFFFLWCSTFHWLVGISFLRYFDVRLLLAIAYGIISAGAWAVIMSEPWSTSVRWHAHNVWNMLLSLHSFQFSTYFLGQAQAQAEPVRQADNPTKSMTTFFLLSRNCNKRNYNSYSYIAVHVCGSECVCADMYVRLWYK